MRRWLIVALTIAVAVLGACGNEGNDEGGSFDLALTADEEVCEGDTCGGEGSGNATIDINSDQNQICYDISLDGIDDANAAHIHEGELGESGDVLVDLEFTGEEGETCVDDVDEGDLEDIAEEPSEFYLNVHSEQYPDGAARGQLGS